MEIQSLSFSYGTHRVLDGIDLEIPEGRVSALVGANGAGKTTLLRCLTGDLRPDRGAVTFRGEPVQIDSNQWKRTIGVVPDGDALLPELTVEEHLLLAGELFGVAEVAERAVSLLALSGLEESRDVVGAALSAGMRKRLSVALALVHAPQLFLFDEPLNGMDYASSETFFSMIDYLRSAGRTVIISGHSLQAIARVADMVVEIGGGAIRRRVEIDRATSGAEDIAAKLKLLVPEMQAVEIRLPWFDR